MVIIENKDKQDKEVNIFVVLLLIFVGFISLLCYSIRQEEKKFVPVGRIITARMQDGSTSDITCNKYGEWIETFKYAKETKCEQLR